MGYLLTRRREMILAGGSPAPVGPLIYQLENRVVTDSEIIDTGVAPFAPGVSCTILFDMNITTNPTNTAQAYRYVLAYVAAPNAPGTVKHAFKFIKPSQWNGNIRAEFFSDGGTNILKSAAGRKRIAITHEANASSISVWARNGTDAAFSCTASPFYGQTAVATSSVMTLGADYEAGRGLPPGTINLVEVYNVILPRTDIDAFLA